MSATNQSELNEPVLPDDYPLYVGYFYVADGKVITNDWCGITAATLRQKLGVKEIRRCDAVRRGLFG